MDMEKLKTLLKPWLSAETWHSGDPLDDQRFHLALKSAFDEFGVHISSDDFQQAIVLCLHEYRPRDVTSFENDVEEFAQRGLREVDQQPASLCRFPRFAGARHSFGSAGTGLSVEPGG